MRDGSIDKFAEIVIYFIQKGKGTLSQMKKLFKHVDSQKRNAIHLAAYYGKGIMLLHICAIIKLLIADAEGRESVVSKKDTDKEKKKTLLKHLIPSKQIKKGFKKGFDAIGNLLKIKGKNKRLAAFYKKLFLAKDIDGNTPLDLACIRGFFQSEDDLSTLNKSDFKIITEIFREIDEGQLRLLEETGKHKLFGKYHDDLESIKKRFSGFVNKDEKQIENPKNNIATLIGPLLASLDEYPKSTKDLSFLSCRSFCLSTLLEVTKNLNLSDKLIPRKDYVNRNNPLHWAFYWADLHSVLQLMKHNMQMVFWTNEEEQMPPHMIFRTKNSKLKNNSIIILESVISEISEYLKLKFIDQKYLKGSINTTSTEPSSKAQENKFEYTLNLENVSILKCNYILHSEILAKSYIKRFRDRMNFYVNMKDYSSRNYIAINCEEGSSFSRLLRSLKDSLLVKSKRANSPDKGKLFRKFQESELKEELNSLFCWHVLTSCTSLIPVKLFSKLDICPFSPFTNLKYRSILQELCMNCESIVPI